MNKRHDLKVVFKTYDQAQPLLLPPSLEEMIPANHPVRVVNQVIDAVDIQPLLSKYKPGGTSSFHPRLLLKVLVYAYINNIYSSRKIEAALRENIHFMWLSALSTPDHNTINRFRGERLREALEKIFSQVVLLLQGEGLLSIKELYVDGTKIEANANRYTFVWGKSIQTNREKIKEQLRELWHYAQSVCNQELDEDPEPSDFTAIDAEKVQHSIEQINEALQDKEVPKAVKQKLAYAKKHWPSNLKKYAEQEKILGEGRSSYAKTDEDATFMRLKEDHMKNGQLKPAYNVQIATTGQYVVNYSIHQSTIDTTTLIPHLQALQEHYGALPQSVVADAGYGSQENYQFLEENHIAAYVKYGTFDRQQNKTMRDKHPFSADKLYYNKEQDCFICPMGQKMQNRGTYTKRTRSGFQQTIHRYEAQRCEGCPLRGMCHQAKGRRIIEVNHDLNRLKQKADERLKSEEGIARRKQRCWDVEPVFGSIKHNHYFRRFMLRGIEKVKLETGLLALAHNLRKRAA